MGIPKHFNLILREDTKFLHILKVNRYDPKVLDSTVFCCLHKNWIRELLMKIIIPVWDIHVILLPAWLASTNAYITTSLPRGSDIFGGSSSSTSP